MGFLAAVAAVVLGWIPEGKFQMSHAVLLCSSSVATAFIASLLQGKYTHCDTVVMLLLLHVRPFLTHVQFPVM